MNNPKAAMADNRVSRMLRFEYFVDISHPSEISARMLLRHRYLNPTQSDYLIARRRKGKREGEIAE